MQKKAITTCLQTGLAQLKMDLPGESVEKLVHYLDLLHKWNAVHNLTAVRDPLEMVTKHLLDSLVLAPYVKTGTVIDVGTGAGLPGIPLSISNQTQDFVLVDSHQKKITFVEHVILSLKLDNCRALCERVEKIQSEPFDWVVSRAFASLSEFVKLAGHLCKPSGRLVAMKAEVLPAEMNEVGLGFMIEKIIPVKVPGLEAKRSLVFMKRN